MTIKQLNSIKELPNTKPKYSISQAMRKGGYSETSSRSGHNIANVRRCAKQLGFFDRDRIEKDILTNRKEARQAQEYSVVKEIDYHRMKVAGMITDKSEIDNKHPEKIIIQYVNASLQGIEEPRECPSQPRSEAIDNKTTQGINRDVIVEPEAS